MMKKSKCTLFPEGDWSNCCAEHNAAYREGGTRYARQQADWDLFCCVFDGGHPTLAILMYWGVRLFGGPFWPHRLRWGNGHKWLESNSYAKSTDIFFDDLISQIHAKSDPLDIIEKLIKSHPSGRSPCKTTIDMDGKSSATDYL